MRGLTNSEDDSQEEDAQSLRRPSESAEYQHVAANADDEYGGSGEEAGIPLLSASTPWEDARPLPRSDTPFHRKRSSIFAALCAVAALVVVASLSAVGYRHQPGPARNFQLLQRTVVAKLKGGERLRIGIVGGSISAMPNAYGDHVVEWLNRNWPAQDGRPHEVINMAIPGSESGVASICLGTFFGYRPSHDAVPPIDLLLVEFAYNDNGILPGSEGQTDFTISRTSNYERIFRTALSWPVPVMVVELVSYSGDVRRPPLRNSFLSSSGYSHAQVAQHYSVPVIDFAQAMYSWPQLDDLTGFYVDKGIHLSQAGHIFTASMITRELIFQLSVATNASSSVIDLAKVHPDNSGPSWPHLAAWNAQPFSAPLEAPSPSAPLSAMPEPRWQLGPTPLWDCLSSQINHTKAALEQAAVVQDGWEMMIDQSDGGRTRSVSRPGFTANATDSHLVYDLHGGGMNGPTALLYRRSWRESADALVWLDQDRSSTGARSQNGPSCPRAGPVRLRGTWPTPTTQMVLDEICGGAGEWSRKADSEKPTFLHVLTVAPDREEKEGKYFKSYGFAVAG
ncbi:hypothetical protein JCM10908_007050 [Rhodotorula pacifica]|uniref:SGNH/GDSL hydrolase family protein n=1 Tax=Rhodotorula pacifica TaxID=1495444 RepID=UPI00316B9D15